MPGIFIAGLVYGTLKGLGTLAEATDANNADHKTGVALALGSITMLVIIVILSISSRNSSSPGRQRLGWASLLLGADGRVSTSKAGVLLWTFGLAYAASFLAGIAGLFQVPVFETSSNSNWTDYLVLLGGPFAAAVLAKAIVLTKSVNGTLAKDVIPGLADPNALGPAAPSGDPVAPEPNANQQPDPAPAQGSNTLPTGLLTNDSGNVDVVDAQYLVFNLVAFLFAAFAFLAQNFDSEIVSPTSMRCHRYPLSC